MSHAPAAPGRLGEALDPAAVQTYLTDLDGWVRARRVELDELDAAAIAAGRGAETAGDMTLAMAIWKSVADRYQLLVVTFDGGRVTRTERERLSVLVWGLDAAGDDAPAVSLPEACRLSDALVGQLRTRLQLVPGADASAARIKGLRAQLERLRDQVALEPPTTRAGPDAARHDLSRRLVDLTERAQRGADVGGLLGPLEIDAALLERDLIVGNARRREARDRILAARALRTTLEAREAALTTLVEVCVATVSPAPRYAVPDVSALGPVPTTAAEIDAYAARLARVGQAMALAEHAYAAAVAERGDLVALLDGFVAKATALGVAQHPDVAESEQRAREVLARRPTPMSVARQLVTTYRSWLDQASTAVPTQETA